MDEATTKILEEVRRQGRAAVAAQASAEACLDAVGRLERSLQAPSEPAETGARAFLEKLIPVFDAFERVVESAQANRRTFPWKLWPKSENEDLRILRAQLHNALSSAGVELIRSVGVPFDEERHRALERRFEEKVSTPTVREVLAPGYALNGQLIREAQVIVALTPKEQGGSP